MSSIIICALSIIIACAFYSLAINCTTRIGMIVCTAVTILAIISAIIVGSFALMYIDAAI